MSVSIGKIIQEIQEAQRKLSEEVAAGNLAPDHEAHERLIELREAAEALCASPPPAGADPDAPDEIGYWRMYGT